MKKTLIAAAVSAALAGCASYPPSGGYSNAPVDTHAQSRGTYSTDAHAQNRGTYSADTHAQTSGTGNPPIARTATGAAMGAVAGNVLGYLTGSDRKTATLLGAVVGGGIGYWQGLQADRRLQDAHAASDELARVQAAQNTYRYDQPRLYAREVNQGGQKIAAFDKLETPFPNDAIRYRSQDAESVLNKLGSLASRTNASVTVYAPTNEMRDFMINELRQGAGGGANLNINTAYGAESKVVIGNVSAV